MAVLLGLLSSCNHKDLCYMHSHTTRLKVVYDWTEAPEANVAGMGCFFYSLDNAGRRYRFDIPGANSMYIDLIPGKYKIVTYNDDTQATNFNNTDDFDSHKAVTRIGDILEPMYGNGVTSQVKTINGERVMITPDALYGCSSTEIEIKPYGTTATHIHGSRAETATVTSNDSDQIITLRPHDMLCHYSFEVRNVKQAKHISRISATISGMAGSMYLADESLDKEPVTLPLSASADGDNQKITGQFLTFGHNEQNTAPHRMAFYVVMDDGSKYSITAGDKLDVTDQVHGAPDKKHVHIIIDGLDLPEPMDSESAFNSKVSDWGEINEEIKV